MSIHIRKYEFIYTLHCLVHALTLSHTNSPSISHTHTSSIHTLAHTLHTDYRLLSHTHPPQVCRGRICKRIHTLAYTPHIHSLSHLHTLSRFRMHRRSRGCDERGFTLSHAHPPHILILTYTSSSSSSHTIHTLAHAHIHTLAYPLSLAFWLARLRDRAHKQARSLSRSLALSFSCPLALPPSRSLVLPLFLALALWRALGSLARRCRGAERWCMRSRA